MSSAKRVLVVEDETIIAADIQDRLTGMGYDVAGSAISGERAVELAFALEPDLVLMDIMLKGEMDGIAAAETIRDKLGIPIIYLTAYADPVTLERAKVTVPYGYLIKPFQDQELRSTIEMALFRCEMEQVLREKENWLSTVLNSIGDAVLAVDSKGAVTFLNPSAEMLMFCTSQDLKGRRVDEVARLSGHGEGLAHPLMDAVDGNKEITSDDARLLLAGGVSLPVEFTASPIKDEKGEPMGGVLVMRDISTRKRAEEQIRAAMLDAQAASQAKSQFLANMSHELRTPMNGILGMTELLRSSQLDEEQEEEASMIKKSAEALLLLINDILDLSKLEAGHAEMEPADYDLRKLIDMTMVGLASQATSKGLKLTYAIAPDVPMMYFGDAGRLRQVLLNLAGNALKFTDSGSVHLDVSRHATWQDHDPVLLFRVEDTGIGIDKDKQDSMFESFTQVDGSTTRRHGGSGLGLAISRRMVKMMGGEIFVESEPGKGSVFSFTIRSGNGGNWQDEGPRKAAAQRPLNVLLADDNGINQLFARKTIESAGHRVTVAFNGKEAVECMRQERFDVVFMDLQMPVMDGLEATRLIRSPDGGGMASDVPILAFTAYDMPGDRDKCLRAGMDECLIKPFSSAQLLLALERVARGEFDQAAKGGGCERSLDLKAALMRMSGNEALLRELLTKYMDTVPSILDEMRESLEKGEHESFVRHAHSLRAASAGVGALRVRDVAHEVEFSSASEFSPDAGDMLADLENEAGRTAECIAERLKNETLV